MGKHIVINERFCKGCGICAAFCPRSALEIKGGKARLKEENSCVKCGMCEKRCPDYAIFISEEDA